jgi:6-phosphogluconolactonase
VNKREIVICQDSADLCRQAADRFIELASEAINQRDRFAVALSGGSTPRGLYALLGAPEYRGEVAWSNVHLFWGDERSVPPDDAESNFRMVQEALLAKISLPGANVHRMLGEAEPAAAAAAYEAELRQFFALPAGSWPRFDLVLLGLGDDGHTASLFPGSSVLNETEHLVAPSYVERLNAYRLTLTFPVINHAAEVAFLVSGQNKAAMVKAILAASGTNYPAARIRPVDGELRWFITQDAAGDAVFSTELG